ncbi:hypothetical protein GCM10023322_56230 [Rugosimonospora acidiphila]|uniref:Major facilitator superfamily (MFS) profile domain-containing protein n=1 Tax=Rugosimonospora acidiphila TaxID=556531 RepID=A0ABP9SB29_9ACTN
MTRSVAAGRIGVPARTGLPAGAVLASLANVIVLGDATIATIALPSIKDALGMSAAQLPWIVNGYSLAFGGCLIFGGYAADRFGPRRLFAVGMVLFGLGSVCCALAGTGGQLVVGRIVQGVGGALFSPAALTVVSRAGSARQRTRALAVWSGAGACAVALGPGIGGVLTGTLGWHSVFWLPAVACCVVALAGARRLGGATGGAQPEPGSAAPALAAKFPSARVLTACGVLALGSAALVAVNYCCTLWLQEVLGLNPIRAGFALSPLSVGIVAGSMLAPVLMRRAGERMVAALGLAVAAVGALLLVTTSPRVAMPVLLPILGVLALGFGVQSVPVSALATAVARRQGLASAGYQTAGQLGGAAGLALLASLASWRSARLPVGGDQALVSGYHLAFLAGTAALTLAALLVVGLGREPDLPPPPGEPDAVHARLPEGHRGLRGE